MKIPTKKILRGLGKAVALGAAMACLSASSSAEAALVTSGGLCFTAYGTNNADLDRNNTWLIARNSTILVDCPLSIDHVITSPVIFRAQVQDSHPTQDFSCQGFVIDLAGNVVSVTPTMSISGTGPKLLSGSASVPSTTTDRTYVLECQVPGISPTGQVSSLRTIKVF